MTTNGLSGLAAPRPARVLVVEDDPAIARVLRDLLVEAGHTVTVVDRGQTALASAEEADLILLDLGLPDLDGIEVCRLLRARPNLARVPIMVLTARGEPSDRVDGIQSGADDYLAKPFSTAELLARIEALLRARQIEAALRERTHQLDTLRRLTGTLVNAVAVEELAQRIVDAVPDAFGQDSGFLGGALSTVDQDRRLIRAHALTNGPLASRVLAMLGRPLDEIQSVFDPPANLQHEVACDGQPREGEHLAEFLAPTISSDVAGDIERMLGIRGAIAQPVKVQGETVGVFLFVLTKSPCSVTGAERALIADFANTAGVALENVRLYATVEGLTLTDPLTGVPNRRHFDRELTEELARAERRGYTFALLLVDIDEFKPYNDTHGHQEGDRALRMVADLLSKTLRATDFVARYGGEEFAVLLPGGNTECARIVGAKLCRAISELPGLGLTVSIGGAIGPMGEGGATAVIAAADEALYTAKRAGRNRTVVGW